MSEIPPIPDVSTLLAELRAATDEVRTTATSIAAERETLAREVAETEDRRTAAARRGELGEDWRRLQARIDVGQTSLAAVLTGEDTSPEALRIADATSDRLVGLTHEARTWIETSDEDPYAELDRSAAVVQESLRRIAELNPGDNVGPGWPEGERP